MSVDAEKKTIFSQSNKQGMRNPWVIGWLTLLILVFGVNAGMVVTAVATNPGLVDKDYYERGRNVEREYLQRAAERTALGWVVDFDVPADVLVDRTGVYRFAVEDKYGNAIEGAEVTLAAYRPSDALADFEVALDEVGPGQYHVPMALPLKGIWDLKVTVVRGADRWDLTRRVSVRG